MSKSVQTARIGDIIISRTPDQLEALALGSCIACIVYDETIKVACMAHILLPESSTFKSDDENKPGKYADTAIPEVIKLILNKGAKRERLKAKIAGGARMFEMTGKNKLTLDVGLRNIDAVRNLLQKNNIPIVAQDVGETYGRTVLFDIETCILTIKTGLTKSLRSI